MTVPLTCQAGRRWAPAPRTSCCRRPRPVRATKLPFWWGLASLSAWPRDTARQPPTLLKSSISSLRSARPWPIPLSRPAKDAAALQVRRHPGPLHPAHGAGGRSGGVCHRLGTSASVQFGNSAGYGVACLCARLWVLMPFSLRLTERFDRQGGVDTMSATPL